MKRVLGIVFVGFAFFDLSFARDFSQKSNDELISMSGSFAPNEAVEYLTELSKRMQKMSENERRAFHLRLKEERLRAEGEMLVKDWRARNEAICTELRKAPTQDRFLSKISKRYCKKIQKETVHRAY